MHCLFRDIKHTYVGLHSALDHRGTLTVPRLLWHLILRATLFSRLFWKTKTTIAEEIKIPHFCVTTCRPKIFNWLIDWLIDWLFTVYVPLKNFSLIWRRHHCRRRARKFRPMLGAQGLWAGRDLYRAPPAVTRDLGFSGLIRRTAQFSLLLWHTRGCGRSILTRIITGKKFDKL
jgi:hypothetical protein